MAPYGAPCLLQGHVPHEVINEIGLRFPSPWAVGANLVFQELNRVLIRPIAFVTRWDVPPPM